MNNVQHSVLFSTSGADPDARSQLEVAGTALLNFAIFHARAVRISKPGGGGRLAASNN